MKTKTRCLPATRAAIAEAAAILRAGGLVAFPTETVYGLGADATSGKAVAGIYAAKQRPSFNPLISHVASLEAACRYGVFNTAAETLARAFWPGPLTLVLPAVKDCLVSDLARAGLPTLALRAPAHPVAQALIEAAGLPIAAPSANLSGRVSPTTAAHVLEDLDGAVDIVLDGGATEVGVESTVIACLDGAPALLRPGGLTRAAIEAVLGLPLAGAATTQAPQAPGMLASHYAPRAAVRLGATQVAADEAALDFGGRLAGALCLARRELSASGDLAEAAANLFGFLRDLDASGASRIAVAPVPQTGLGEAINDRLARAAAPR